MNGAWKAGSRDEDENWCRKYRFPVSVSSVIGKRDEKQPTESETRDTKRNENKNP